MMNLILNLLSDKHCVKSVLIRSYSGPHFPECGKMWTRITPNTDTFYAVKIKRITSSEVEFYIRTVTQIHGAVV